jgi:hypothetical protein
MALTSTLVGTVLFAVSRANGGYAMALRAAARATSTIAGRWSFQRLLAFSEPQTEALAAAIEVEILFTSWRARHQMPEQEARRRRCLCNRDQ